MPPFRVDAPQPSVCASSNVTATPRVARTRAALIPAYPPPMTTTSALSGNARPARSGNSGIVACQKDRRSKSSLSVPAAIDGA